MEYKDRDGDCIVLRPCEVCKLLKGDFHLCAKGHVTCDDCKDVARSLSSQSQPLNSADETKPPSRLSASMFDSSPSARSDSMDHFHGFKPANFAFKSPVKTFMNTLSSAPPSRTQSPSSRASTETITTEKTRIFCVGCRDQADVYPASLPSRLLENLSAERSRESGTPNPVSIVSDSKPSTQGFFPAIEIKRSPSEPSTAASLPGRSPAPSDFSDAARNFRQHSTSPQLTKASGSSVVDCPSVPVAACPTSATRIPEASDEYAVGLLPPERLLKPCESLNIENRVDFLQQSLAQTYHEILVTREQLDEVMHTTERLEMDVDMLRNGLHYVYVNYDNVVRRREVRIEETVDGIPLLLMFRQRLVNGQPHVGFFLGLEKYNGVKFSPLKKTIVIRAHNSSGKTIERQTLRTFENGRITHPAFDLSQRSVDNSLWGFQDFLSKTQISELSALRNGILCFSVEISSLSEA